MKVFNEVITDVTKTAIKIPQSNYLINGKYKIFDQGKDYCIGYSNSDDGLADSYPYIIFGDHTRVVKYVDEPCFIGADGVKLLKVSNKDFIPKYVYYNILAKPIVGQGYSRHFKFLKNLLITENTKQEQQKIITQLDTIQSAIDKKKQQVLNLDELLTSRFIELFGDNPIESGKWDIEKLGNIGSCKNGMNFHYDENGIEIYCLGVSDFKNNSIVNCDNLPRISLNKAPSEEYLLKNEDIVFVRSNGNKELVGRSVIVYPNKPTTFSGFCIRYRKEYEGLNSIFLLRYLKTEYARKKIAGRGANIQNLNQQILSELPVPIPPIDLQNIFVNYIQNIEKSKMVISQQIMDLQEFMDSKMDAYFS